MGAAATSVRTRPARTAPARRVSTPSKRVRSTAGAAAPARKKAPVRRPAAAPARRTRVTPPAGVVRLPATAVAGTAGAVSGLADSPFVVSMTRSRLWIGVLGVLLGGIVALQVWGLSLSAQSSANAEKIDELQQQISVYGSRIAKRSSMDRIATLAAQEGLDTPTPKAINYLDASGSDAAAAAKRLSKDEISILSSLPTTSEIVAPTAAPVTTTAPTTTVDPVTGAPIDPTTGLPVVAPATAATTTSTPTVDPVTGAAIDPATGAVIP
jgi:hypothetical protein